MTNAQTTTTTIANASWRVEKMETVNTVNPFVVLRHSRILCDKWMRKAVKWNNGWCVQRIAWKSEQHRWITKKDVPITKKEKKNTGKQNSEMNECKMHDWTTETDREPENGRTNGKSAQIAGSEWIYDSLCRHFQSISVVKIICHFN